MPPKWPTLPNKVGKGISLTFFVLSAVIETTIFKTLHGQMDSHCIAGNEVSYELGIYVVIMAGIVLSDIVYVILIIIAMPMDECNYGADVTTIAYNFISGLLSFASFGSLARVENCGNKAFAIITGAACGLTTVSGLFHFLNGAISLAFISTSERTLTMNRVAYIP